MNATNPIEIEGQSYPLLGVNLVITGKYTDAGTPDASVVCNLIPTAIVDGVAVQAPVNPIPPILFGTLAGADSATQECMTAISVALQNFITARGI